MDVSRRKRGFSTPRILLLSLSFVSLVLCVISATAHYLKWASGNRGQPVGWLFSMFFLLLAFSPPLRQIAASLKSLIKPKTAFFVFWILVFVVSHLWNFNTAPWNGNGLFDESGWDLWFLKSHIIGRPFQPVWPDHVPLARETLFHHYVWGFFRLFGYNILSYEAALFVIWCTTFIFTLLLVDLFFRSYIVTSLTALIFNFLPFAFIFTFAGYRYPMATALCVASVYFLHLGFKTASAFFLSLGGITAGLCLGSAIPGKQDVLALLLFALLYAGLYWKTLKRNVKLSSVSLIVYGFAVAAAPILCYIVLNYHAYTYYESTFVRRFWQAMWGNPSPNDMRFYITQLWRCFFSNPAGDQRQFIPDALPIPLPYYVFLVPGLVLAVVKKRYEIAMLAAIPVVGAFVAGAATHRLLLPIPFWIILMAFTFAGLLKLKLRLGFEVYLWGAAAVILMLGLFPSIAYIHGKTKDPFSIYHFPQGEVATSRFLRNIVAGKEPSDPRLERDELKRDEGVPDAPYETFICPNLAYSILHLFLHDYGDQKILSFCGGSPMFVMTEQDIWRFNKKAIVDYVPSGKDLKLIWEGDPRDPKIGRIIGMFEPLRNLGTEQSISYSFAGRQWNFYVLNIGNKNIPQFQEGVRPLPDSLP